MYLFKYIEQSNYANSIYKAYLENSSKDKHAVIY